MEPEGDVGTVEIEEDDAVDWWDDLDSPAFSSQIVTIEQSKFGKAKSRLTKLVADWLEETANKTPRRLNRLDGNHPSDMGSHWCGRFAGFRKALPIAVDGKRFSGKVRLRFEWGHAGHHHWQQNIYGKMRILRGTWVCNRCRLRVENELMPNHPCSRCGWQVDAETKRQSPRSKRSRACATKCIWPGGFSNRARDCAQCESGGGWMFAETRILIPEFEIVGKVDGVILYQGEERVLEFKTKYPEAFPLAKPDEDHVVQCNIYMWAMGIPRGLIVYLNKSTGETTEFLIEPDEGILKMVKQRIEGVEASILEGILPNGICGGPKAPDAKICSYRDVCFMGYDVIDEIIAHLKENEPEHQILHYAHGKVACQTRGEGEGGD